MFEDHSALAPRRPIQQQERRITHERLLFDVGKENTYEHRGVLGVLVLQRPMTRYALDARTALPASSIAGLQVGAAVLVRGGVRK
jgi:hypothetical protein